MQFWRVVLVLLLAIGGVAQTAFGQERAAEAIIRQIEGPQHPRSSDLDSLSLAGLMDHFNVPGLSIAVIRDFEIHWARAYGIADVQTGAKVDTATLFQAASISKPVNAMAVLKAVQDGMFSLDDDINTILRSWQLPASPFTKDRKVTPRMLASHVAGLGDGFGYPGYKPYEPLPAVLQILAGEPPSNVKAVFFARAPMTAFQYSGGGVTILQQALVDATGKPYEEILQHDVLGPIGMTRSTFAQPLPADRDRNAARGHGNHGEAMGAKWHVYPEQAAAGLWTTPIDLAKFAIDVQKSLRGETNRVLSPALAREMVCPVGIGDFATGFAVTKEGQGWYFRHGGSNWGFRCGLVAHRVKGYGFVIMTNADGGGRLMAELKSRIERAYGYDSLDRPQ